MDLESRNNGEYKKEEREEQKGQEQNFHVLAVDDSLIDRKLLERLLTYSSYQVTCVDSGNKALEYLGLLDNNSDQTDSTSVTSSSSSSSSSCTSSSSQSLEQQGSKVNLIITDYSMPGMNGYDLLKKVKGSSWKDIPVVVMSSENVPSRINMCLEGGAEEFLLKPVQLSDLNKIHSHLSKPLDRSSQNRNVSVIDDDVHNSDTTTYNNGKCNSNGNKRKLITRKCSERRLKMKELWERSLMDELAKTVRATSLSEAEATEKMIMILENMHRQSKLWLGVLSVIFMVLQLRKNLCCVPAL